MDADKTIGKIGVLLGGISSEREISLRSGRAVYEALKSDGLDVVRIDIESDDIEEVTRQISGAQIDIAFIALHGKFGEDGTVQEILDGLGLPYTGSGAEASKVTFNKADTQAVLKKNNIPVAPHVVLKDNHTSAVDEIIDGLGGLPVVVKPACEGSSIGVSVVTDKDVFQKALDEAFRLGKTVLIEKFIAGREFTVGILGDQALPVIEIKPKAAFFDFKAKYESQETEYAVPAAIEKELALLLQETALNAHNILGCRGFSRLDFIADGSGRTVVLEINTIPGFTSTSLVPKAAQAAGIDFVTLCKTLIHSAYAEKKIKNQSAACG